MTEPSRRIVDAVLAARPRLGSVRLLAIDGPSGSGKSTLGRWVADELAARALHFALISTDDFATWDEPVAWWSRFSEGVLRPLAAGEQGEYRRTDWTDGIPRLGESIVVSVPQILVLEGVSAGRASVRPLLSYLCWVDGPDAAGRLERGVARDGEQSREHLRRWQEFERGWFPVDGVETHADDTVRFAD